MPGLCPSHSPRPCEKKGEIRVGTEQDREQQRAEGRTERAEGREAREHSIERPPKESIEEAERGEKGEGAEGTVAVP